MTRDMTHDPALVAKVAEALWEVDRCPKPWAGYETCYVHGANWSESGQWCEAVERWARAVVDALDVPAMLRAAKAEVWDAGWSRGFYRAQARYSDGGEDASEFDSLNPYRAAALDPEEGGHE